jgi:hypothetical protein
MYKSRLLLLLLFPSVYAQDSTKIDKEFTLETTLLGYFFKNGTRNTTLKVKKGSRVRINIVNGEVMTHDIALENLGIKSGTISDKGSKSSITFVANKNDTYYCTVPGHSAVDMVGKLEVVDGEIIEKIVVGKLPLKNGKPFNLNFETGDLRDWIATGDAFTSPVISTDPSPIHDKDMTIGFESKNFLSSGGTVNYNLKGTLSSVSFGVTQPCASFTVSGISFGETLFGTGHAKNRAK